MVKLRRNYSDGKRGSSGKYAGRLGIFFIVMIVAIVLIGYGLKDRGDTTPKGYVPAPRTQTIETDNNSATGHATALNFLPADDRHQIVHHQYYSLGYDEDAEQAAWVAYSLTAESLYVPNVKRSNWFDADPLVKTRSAAHSDYTGSGYTRGHLAPAGDMAFNREAMTESFYMSNMSPQIAPFNAGVWKELEETVRDWAIKHKELYIVTGPILDGDEKTIGRKTKVAVPKAFYKAILDLKTPNLSGIAFVIPHRVCEEPLSDFATSIDNLESQLNLDLYSALLDDNSHIEASYDLSHWKFDQKKFNDRVNKWNNQR